MASGHVECIARCPHFPWGPVWLRCALVGTPGAARAEGALGSVWITCFLPPSMPIVLPWSCVRHLPTGNWKVLQTSCKCGIAHPNRFLGLPGSRPFSFIISAYQKKKKKKLQPLCPKADSACLLPLGLSPAAAEGAQPWVGAAELSGANQVPKPVSTNTTASEWLAASPLAAAPPCPPARLWPGQPCCCWPSSQQCHWLCWLGDAVLLVAPNAVETLPTHWPPSSTDFVIALGKTTAAWWLGVGTVTKYIMAHIHYVRPQFCL